MHSSMLVGTTVCNSTVTGNVYLKWICDTERKLLWNLRRRAMYINPPGNATGISRYRRFSYMDVNVCVLPTYFQLNTVKSLRKKRGGIDTLNSNRRWIQHSFQTDFCYFKDTIAVSKNLIDKPNRKPDLRWLVATCDD